MRVKLEEVCKRIYAGGDVPKDRYSEVKTKEYPIPIYANAEKDNGLYGYTDKAREEELSITVAARGTIGFTAIRREPFLPVVRLITVVPDTAKVSERYLYYVLKNCKPQSSGTSIPQLTVPDIKKNRLELYDISEQERIADQLDTVSKVIELRKQELEALDNLIKARFVEMFGDMKPTVTIERYIAELRGGKSLAGTEECKNKVLKTGAATFGWFDPEQYKYLPVDYEPLPEHKVETGDVIISRMNTPELVGACSYVFEAPEDMYYPDRLWKVIPQPETNPIFLWQLLWDREIRRQIKEKSGGTSGTMHNISKSKLLEIKCIDAPIELQNQFAGFVHQVDKSKVVYMSIHKKLGKQKKQIKYKIA